MFTTRLTKGVPLGRDCIIKSSFRCFSSKNALIQHSQHVVGTTRIVSQSFTSRYFTVKSSYIAHNKIQQNINRWSFYSFRRYSTEDVLHPLRSALADLTRNSKESTSGLPQPLVCLSDAEIITAINEARDCHDTGLLDDAARLLVKQQHVTTTKIDVLEQLVQAYAVCGELQRAFRILTQVLEYTGKPPSAQTYLSILKAACERRALPAALQAVASMRRSNVEMSIDHYSTVIPVLANEEALAASYGVGLWSQMRSNGIVPDPSILKACLTYMQHSESCVVGIEALQLLKQVDPEQVTQSVFEYAVQQLCRHPVSFSEAFRLFYQMRDEQNMQPGSDTYLSLVAACLPYELFDILDNTEDIIDDIGAIPAAMHCQFDPAVALFSEMNDKIASNTITPTENDILFDHARSALLRLYRMRVIPLTNEAQERIAVSKAEEVFKIQEPKTISVWEEMIKVYLQYQLYEKAVKLTAAMQASRVGLFYSDQEVVKKLVIKIENIREDYIGNSTDSSTNATRLSV